MNRLIKRLRLSPHPEGGYFRETYRARETISASALPRRFKGPRAISTAIYFLLTKERPSKLHRLKSDEMWHFYDGGEVRLELSYPNGKKRTIKLGRGNYQAVVPAGVWFGARVIKGRHALLGCTVAPGFDFRDFELKGAG